MLLLSHSTIPAAMTADDTKAKVQKDKDKLAKALGDDEAAWNDYLQAYGNGDVMNLLAGPKTNGLSMPDRADHFKKTFKQALKCALRVSSCCGHRCSLQMQHVTACLFL